MCSPFKIIFFVFLSIILISSAKADSEDLILRIQANAKHSDYIQVYFSNTSSSYNPNDQIKKKIKGGELQEIEFHIPSKGNIPYLRIDWGGKPSNFFEIKSISFQLNNVTFKLEPESIGSYFTFNNYIKKINSTESTFNIATIKVKGKNSSFGLRFEKITNILYQLKKIETVFVSQIEILPKIEDDNYILVYYSDNEAGIPAFKYSNSVRLHEGVNTIYTENYIRDLRINYYGKESNEVVIKKIVFSSDLIDLKLKGSEILSKFNIQGPKKPPIISTEEISFVMSSQPTSFRLKTTIHSKNEIYKSALEYFSLFLVSIIVLVGFNLFWARSNYYLYK